ncbi:MAG: response regulator [Candidatus Omnitrophica bacterium]|nr:response regulator [Candidatus Omnitrophota bacterium]
MATEAEYFSFVRHELRNQLGIIREGTSQIIDGLGNKDCSRCQQILKPTLECAEKLNKLIEELVSVEAFNKMVTEGAPFKPCVAADKALSTVAGEPVPETAASSQGNYRQGDAMERKKKILVVDDELNFLEMVKRRLSDSGYEVVTATTGAQAMEKVVQEKPDVVFLDVMMPGIDGLEVLKDMRAKNNNIPIYIMTAYSNEERFKSAQEWGASGFITKTGDLKKAIKNIENFINLTDKYKGKV